MEVEYRGLGSAGRRDVAEIPQTTYPPRDALREAAPDLLAACRMALEHLWGEEIDAPTAYQLEKVLTEAIARAEGR